jgi:hypothetical protein
MQRRLASTLSAFAAAGALLLAFAAQVYADTQGATPPEGTADRNLWLGVVVLVLLVASLIVVRPRRRG